jgi:hypothetical protein
MYAHLAFLQTNLPADLAPYTIGTALAFAENSLRKVCFQSQKKINLYLRSPLPVALNGLQEAFVEIYPSSVRVCVRVVV